LISSLVSARLAFFAILLSPIMANSAFAQTAPAFDLVLQHGHVVDDKNHIDPYCLK
jgi:hypothetical protein